MGIIKSKETRNMLKKIIQILPENIDTVIDTQINKLKSDIKSLDDKKIITGSIETFIVLMLPILNQLKETSIEGREEIFNNWFTIIQTHFNYILDEYEKIDSTINTLVHKKEPELSYINHIKSKSEIVDLENADMGMMDYVHYLN